MRLFEHMSVCHSTQGIVLAISGDLALPCLEQIFGSALRYVRRKARSGTLFPLPRQLAVQCTRVRKVLELAFETTAAALKFFRDHVPAGRSDRLAAAAGGSARRASWEPRRRARRLRARPAATHDRAAGRARREYADHRRSNKQMQRLPARCRGNDCYPYSAGYRNAARRPPGHSVGKLCRQNYVV